MDDKSANPRSLKDAMRTLRVGEAERTGVVVALRDAEMARLTLLKDRIDPVIAQVPAEIDLFDIGLTPGDPARLWVDMISFVEMARDKRTYRFLQDTRLGRSVIMESDRVDEVGEAITAYIAQRLIERERMLAGRVPPQGVARAIPESAPDQAVLGAVEALRAEARAQAGMAPATPTPAETAAATVQATTPQSTTPQAIVQNAEPASPAPAQAPARKRRREGVRFGWAAIFILFVLGLALGMAGVLGVAMLAARGL